MDQQQFDALRGAGFHRIPVTREVLADLDTPLSAYLKLADAPYSFLLESAEGGETWGRYSIIGLPARLRVTYTQGELCVQGAEGEERHPSDDPLADIETLRQQLRVAPVSGLPRFAGGLVGYLGYELVTRLERRLAGKERPDRIGCPDIFLLCCDEFVVFDNLRGRVTLVTHADGGAPRGLEHAEQRLDDFAARLRGPLSYPGAQGFAGSAAGAFQPGFARADFCAAVERAREYIRAGDIFQVVLSQRLSAPFSGAPLDVYRALRGLNPSPYMYFFNFGDFHMLGASPEVLVRAEDGQVILRPIAGTRPRGSTPEEDAALAKELRADPKELSEHVMLLDLGRNDVGRVAQTGSVRVTEKMVIERYSHVMHMVSQIQGKLRAGLGPVDVLRAAFPAGTVSGAPKLRALEIIHELEPVKRGIYSGAVGYLGWNGNLDTAIAIRTAVIKGGYLHVQAGAGIVHDSVPEREWEETLNKGRALIRAVSLAGAGAL